MTQGKVSARRTTTWGIDRRLAFIDYRLYWEGRINRKDLQEFFGISVPQSSADLKAYQALAPENMRYDPTEKCYVATNAFTPQFTEAESSAYLNALLSRETGLVADNATFISNAPEVGFAPTPYRNVPVDTLRAILYAWRRHRALHIQYQSMSRPEPTWRKITPHALAHDGLRYHVRSYCHSRQDFRDFVLSRILAAGDSEPSEVDSAADWQWHQIVEVRLAPHRGLTAGQRAAVAREYDMQDGERVIAVRLALLFYLLLQLRLRGQDPRAKPQEIQIELANPAEVEQWEALVRIGGGPKEHSAISRTGPA